MSSTPVRDYDSIDAYPYLPELAGETGERLNPIPRQTYRKALQAALQVPPGEARQALLRAVSSGVGAHLRGMEERQTLDTLRGLLAQTNPDGHRFAEAVAAMRDYVKRVRGLFKKASEAERARGVDMGKSSWFWFDHELAVTEQVIESRLRLAVGPVPARAACDDDTAA